MVDSLGSVDIPISFGAPDARRPRDSYKIRFHVVSDLPKGLLIGMNAIIAMRMSLFPHLGKIEIDGRSYKARSTRPRCPDPMNGDHSREVRLRETFTLRKVGPINVPAMMDPVRTNLDMIIDPVDIGNGSKLVRGPRAVVQGGKDSFQYQLFNATNRPIRLPRGTLLGIARPVKPEQITPMDRVDEIINKLEAEEKAIEQQLPLCAVAEYLGGGMPEELCEEDNKEYMKLLEDITINPDLTTEQRQQVEHLLKIKMKAFASARNPMGKTDLVEFDIDTGDAKPVHMPPYRASPARRKIIKEQIEMLREAKIIQPSNSEWSAPVIVVEQHGKHRMCIDLRALNRVTIGDSYPVPRVLDILESLEGAQWFSSFDLNKGYFQIPNTKRARRRLAFRTQDGLWEPLRMPFGAKGAPATFQRLMDLLLAEGRWLWAMAYIDDIIVYSKSFDEHLKHVSWTLQRMIDGGLTLGANKSHMFMKTVELLGHKVSNIGIMMGDKAVEAIKSQKRPTTVKELSRFLGLVSHWRRFVKNFARVSAPLRDVKRAAANLKQTDLDWTPEAEAAFTHLIDALTSDVLLAHPDYSKPFIIECDASQDGFGAVLSQRDENGYVRPIAFISRQTIAGEKNMSATDLECSGVMWALDKLRPYVEGSDIELRCDHEALKGLADYKGQNRRMIRASAHLMSYLSDIKFIYRPGEKMAHVDQLSRNPQPLTPEQIRNLQEACEVYLAGRLEEQKAEEDHDDPNDVAESLMCWTIEPDTTFKDKIMAVSELDETYTELVDEILIRYDIPDSKPYDRTVWRQVMHHPRKPFMINDGLLYTSSQARNTHTIVVPTDETLRTDILKLYHDTTLAGHRGADKTYAALVDHYYWKGMLRDVKQYVRTCEKCQRSKPDNALPPGLLKSLPLTKRRWNMIQVDWVVGLPESGPQKFTAVMVVIDRMSKRIVLTPTHDTLNASSIVQLMFDNVFKYFGLPSCIISDRDSRLTSDLWRSLMKYLGVQHRYATASHQQTDGATERVIRWLKEALRSYVNKEASNWSSFVSRLEVAHNASVQASTGMTPFELDLGRIPFFLHGPSKPDLAGDPDATRLRQKMELDAIIALDLLDKAQRAQKSQYDARHREVTYKVGDLVLIQSDVYSPQEGVRRRKRGAEQRGRKLGPTFWGPFKITDIPHDNVAQLELAPGMRAHNKISFAYLRKYHPRAPDPTAVRTFDCVVDAKTVHNGEVRWRVRFKPMMWQGQEITPADEWVDETTLKFFGGGAIAEEHREECERRSGAYLAYKLYTFNTLDDSSATYLQESRSALLSTLRDAAHQRRGSVDDHSRDPEVT
ncbi:polyprotein [Trichosporon asahii var. asahii CBS 8904]|uniref:Polyprotein n=1 Tax=Trichosporon asahii var. asahii (strain CBS 8904) TaxID=1220162 RepID=K1VZV0_TRIAC|nr:polyprotein [Trichosporon asahii var. asahii CBS 8904]